MLQYPMLAYASVPDNKQSPPIYLFLLGFHLHNMQIASYTSPDTFLNTTFIPDM